MGTKMIDDENHSSQGCWYWPFGLSIKLLKNAISVNFVINKFTVEKEKPGDDVIDKDLILYWTDEEKRIITGSDILGYLMRNIAKVK